MQGDRMSTRTTAVRASRRRRRRFEAAHLRAAEDLPHRISRIRDEAFGLVRELRSEDANVPLSELDGASDQMQSIANQLGAVEAVIAARLR
jgi:hypothetical protein